MTTTSNLPPNCKRLPREVETAFALKKGELSRLTGRLGQKVRVEKHQNLYFEKPVPGWTVRLRQVRTKGKPGKNYVLTIKGDKKDLDPFKSRVELEGPVSREVWEQAHERPAILASEIAKLFSEHGSLPPRGMLENLELLGGTPTLSRTHRSVFELPRKPDRHVELDQTRFIDGITRRVLEVEVTSDAKSDRKAALAEVDKLLKRAKISPRVEKTGKGSLTRKLVAGSR